MSLDGHEWRRICAQAADALDNAAPGSYTHDLLEAGERVRAAAYVMSGRACGKCGGYGVRAYGDTTTWMGGVGGQSLTEGTCDECWGTGRSDKKGADLRMAMLGVVGEGVGQGVVGMNDKKVPAASLSEVVQYLRSCQTRRGGMSQPMAEYAADHLEIAQATIQELERKVARLLIPACTDANPVPDCQMCNGHGCEEVAP